VDAPRTQVPESVHAGGLDLIRSLGIGNLGATFVGPPFTDVLKTDSRSIHSSAKMPWPARHVRRDLLDALLFEQAKACKITVISGRARSIQLEGNGVSCVEIDGNDRFARAQLIIDATGATQWLRRQLKLPRQVLSAPLLCRRGLARYERISAQAPRFHIEKDGWYWIAAIGSKTAIWTHVTTASYPAPRALPGEFVMEGLTQQVGRTWTLVEDVIGPNYILTGDAAGHLDPAAGDGVTLALQAGCNAATTAHRILRDPDEDSIASKAYSSWWRHRISAKARAMANFYVTNGLAALVKPSRLSTYR